MYIDVPICMYMYIYINDNYVYPVLNRPCFWTDLLVEVKTPVDGHFIGMSELNRKGM